MKQLIQNLKNGKMELSEVPFPSLEKGKILVKNHYSVISSGTEGRSVKDARLGYIGKAKARPKEFKQVIETSKKIGLWQTYRLVMNKLNAPSPLGYSCAGEVIEVGENVTKFKVGDKVACGGQGAFHSEVVSVLENLCVKIPEGVDMRHATFTTIASVAIQGVRQANIKLGENCAVIGLGLLGQFTIQILKAAGVRTIGIDLDPKKVELVAKNGADFALERNTDDIEEKVLNYTKGYGADAVIITAATSSTDPVNLGGTLCRKKGIVVCVGRVSTNLDRDLYYIKELDFKMSCSYGPGRYDPQYEEKGIDYPIGYVRWTENRNMESYLDLVASGKINVDSLITCIFKFNNVMSAYDMIMDKLKFYIGILLEYDIEKEHSKNVKIHDFNHSDDLNIGFIGAGSFAKKFLLPEVKKWGNMEAIATASGYTSRNIADKYNFRSIYNNGMELLNDQNINTVFIATRHDTHYKFVLEALKKGKNVFVEKPLCMNEHELEEIKEEYNKQNVHLMVGFNRRFSPFIRHILDYMGNDTKKTIMYRINLGKIDPSHWTQDRNIGGGRIIGEVCHFLDLSMYLVNSRPYLISSFSMENPFNLEDTLVIIIKFKNGSLASICYFANGNTRMSKEYLEVYCNGSTAILDDFRKLTIFGKKKRKIKFTQNKGHTEEIKTFLSAVKNGKKTPISFSDIYWTTRMTFDIRKSIYGNKIIKY